MYNKMVLYINEAKCLAEQRRLAWEKLDSRGRNNMALDAYAF